MGQPRPPRPCSGRAAMRPAGRRRRLAVVEVENADDAGGSSTRRRVRAAAQGARRIAQGGTTMLVGARQRSWNMSHSESAPPYQSVSLPHQQHVQLLIKANETTEGVSSDKWSPEHMMTGLSGLKAHAPWPCTTLGTPSSPLAGSCCPAGCTNSTTTPSRDQIAPMIDTRQMSSIGGCFSSLAPSHSIH